MDYALLGGILIGSAASLLLFFNGRIAGISGTLSGLLYPVVRDWNWRLSFILGLLIGGIVLLKTNPHVFSLSPNVEKIDYMIAGLLVGLGTAMGNGCTSGHGVCGISRLSLRSIVATLTFITFGILSLIIFRYLRGAV